MHLMHYLNEKGERVYTLKVSSLPLYIGQSSAVAVNVLFGRLPVPQKVGPSGRPTVSAHPGAYRNSVSNAIAF